MSYLQIEYGLLSCCVTNKADNSSHAYIHQMKTIRDASDTLILNDRDCPLLTTTHHIKAIATTKILSAVSIIHECMDNCKLTSKRQASVERETVTIPDHYVIQHDYSNGFFSLNIYCMKCVK